MKNIAGIFDNEAIADHAVADLLAEGFRKDDISLLMSSQTRDRLFNKTDDEAARAAKGAVSGAVIAGGLGALLASLTAVGSLVTGGGALLVTGPIVAGLAGAGAGATLGGIAGALINAGFAADDAHRYEKELKQGKAIVLVHAENDSADLVREILANAGAATKAA